MAKRRKARPAGGRRGNNVIAYIRVSDVTGREESLISDEVQLNELRKLAGREGLVIVDVVKDLDISGRKFDGRSVASIIDRIEGREADGVIVWKISRWGRNTMDSLLNIGELQDAGGFILSATENLQDVDTPAGRFSLTVLLAIAQMFSDEVGKTWANIHDYRRKQGKTSHGTRRLGYVRVKDLTDAQRGALDIPLGVEYLPDPEVAPWVRKAYEDYVAGKSLVSIVTDLNERGLRTTWGNRFTYTSLLGTMDGGFAAGKIVDRRDDEVAYPTGNHEPIISEAVWRAYLRKRSEVVPARVKHAPHRLSRLVFCAGCGSRLASYWRTMRSGERVRYYRCQRMAKSIYTQVCPLPVAVTETKIDAAVLEWLHNKADGESALETELSRAAKVQQAVGDAARIERDIEKARRRLSQLLDLLSSEKVSPEAYALKERELLDMIAALRDDAERVKVDVEVNELPATVAFGAVIAGWDLLDAAVVNEALKKVLRGVVVTRPDVSRGEPMIRVYGLWEEMPETTTVTLPRFTPAPQVAG